MEPYIELFLARPIWIMLGLAVFIGVGYLLIKDDPDYSWEKRTDWPKYLLGLVFLGYAIVLSIKWGVVPFLYWFAVGHIAFALAVAVRCGLEISITAEHVPAEDWLDASSVHFKKMDLPGHILTNGLGLVVFIAANLAGIYLAL